MKSTIQKFGKNALFDKNLLKIIRWFLEDMEIPLETGNQPKKVVIHEDMLLILHKENRKSFITFLSRKTHKKIRSIRINFSTVNDFIIDHSSELLYITNFEQLILMTLEGNVLKQYESNDFVPYRIHHHISTNSLFVSDAISGFISVFDMNMGHQFYIHIEKGTTGICIDEVEEKIFVSKFFDNQIGVFSIDGNFIKSFGQETLWEPLKIILSPISYELLVIEKSGYIKILDRKNDTLSRTIGPFEFLNTITFDVENSLVYFCCDQISKIICKPLSFLRQT